MFYLQNSLRPNWLHFWDETLGKMRSNSTNPFNPIFERLLPFPSLPNQWLLLPSLPICSIPIKRHSKSDSKIIFCPLVHSHQSPSHYSFRFIRPFGSSSSDRRPIQKEGNRRLFVALWPEADLRLTRLRCCSKIGDALQPPSLIPPNQLVILYAKVDWPMATFFLRSKMFLQAIFSFSLQFAPIQPFCAIFPSIHSVSLLNGHWEMREEDGVPYSKTAANPPNGDRLTQPSMVYNRRRIACFCRGFPPRRVRLLRPFCRPPRAHNVHSASTLPHH